MAHQAERFLEQWNNLESGLRLRIVDQTDVDPIGRNPFDDLVRQPLDDGESCRRKLSLEALDQLSVSWRAMLGGSPMVTRPTGSLRLAPRSSRAWDTSCKTATL